MLAAQTTNYKNIIYFRVPLEQQKYRINYPYRTKKICPQTAMLLKPTSHETPVKGFTIKLNCPLTNLSTILNVIKLNA